MGGFATTNVCYSTPFDSEPERMNGFVSKNAQDAIEEALALAIANDKFLVLAQYGGQANNGRILEFYSGDDSLEYPIYFGAGGALILAIICSTDANSSNGLLSFYDSNANPALNSPLYTLDMDGQKVKEDLATPASPGVPSVPLFVMPPGGRLTLKVSGSNIKGPHVQIVFSSAAT